MTAISSPLPETLKILHILRAPQGGLFRHVLDLTRAQIALGHEVGLIVDSLTGGEQAEQSLQAIAPDLALGLSRIPMRRNPHYSDVLALNHILERSRQTNPDVLHGHGSKGGFYARLPACMGLDSKPIRAYTPHGGSFHYSKSGRRGAPFLKVEALLNRVTDVFLFESAYIASCFHDTIGKPKGLELIIMNGLHESEFQPVAWREDAADFLYIGELRTLKGIDVLLRAMAQCDLLFDHKFKLVLIGSGPDEASLKQLAFDLNLQDRVQFAGAMPARQAFSQGRILVIPSRMESLPYIVLEAAAAAKPMIATHVGGIAEIFGPHADRLITSDDVFTLASAMQTEHERCPTALRARALSLQEHVHTHFHISQMVKSVLAGYQQARAERQRKNPMPHCISAGQN